MHSHYYFGTHIYNGRGTNDKKIVNQIGENDVGEKERL